MDIVNKNRGLFITEGIFFIILGILAIALPKLSTLSFEILLAWLFIVGSIVQFVRTFQFHKAGEVVWSLISALLYLAVGIILLAYPLSGILTLTFLLAIFFVVEGIAKLILSYEMRAFGNWGWLLLSGILSVILGALIWSGWPGTAAWVIGLLVGINLLFLGLTQVFLGVGAFPEDRS